MSLAQPLSVVTAGVFVAVLGVLIKYFGYVNLIAGYDPESVTDEDALAEFVGTRTLVIAGLTIAVGGLEYVRPSEGTPWYWVLYVALVLVLAGWIIRGARRYEA